MDPGAIRDRRRSTDPTPKAKPDVHPASCASESSFASIRQACSLDGIQPANLRINLALFRFAESKFLHGLEKERESLSDGFRLLPTFEVASRDLVRKVLQQRIGDGVP